MSDLQLIATQLEISGGIRRDRAEGLLDAELMMPPPIIQKRGALYIMTEVEAIRDSSQALRAGNYELIRDTQMAIIKEFYEFNQNATVTSALKHALEVANQLLFNRNSALLPPERRGVGITLALVRNNELFLAQLPPTQSYVVHQGQMSYYPMPDNYRKGPRPLNPRATQPLPIATGGKHSSYTPALGRYATIDPIFNRTYFDDGDLLVLCSSSLAQALEEDQLEHYFMNSTSREALYNLSEFARVHYIENGYALAVSMKGDYSARSLERAAQERIEAHTATKRSEEGGFKGAMNNMAVSMSAFASRFNPDKNEPDKEEYIFEASLPPTEAVPVRWNQDFEFVDNEPRQAQPPIQQHPGSITELVNLINDNPAADPWIRREKDGLEKPPYLQNRPDPTETDRFKKQQAGVFPAPGSGSPEQKATFSPRNYQSPEAPKPHFAFSEEAAAIPPIGETGKKKRGKQPDSPPQAAEFVDVSGGYGPPLESIKDERKGGFRGGRFLIIGGLILLLGVAALFLVSAAVNLVGGSNDKAMGFVRSAEAKRIQAQTFAVIDPAKARQLISDAQADLDKARKEKPELKDITITSNALKVTSDNINRVVIPADIRVTLDLTNQTGIKMSRAIFSSTNDVVFILDSGRGMVLQLDMQGQIKTILKQGDTASGKTLTKPVLMTPRLDSVLILDDANNVWIYDRSHNSWSAVALGGTSGWVKSVRLADTYQGNLYLVGPGSGQILRYLSGSYSNTPDEWLSEQAVQTANLDRAVTLEVDGRIFGLSSEGVLYQMERPNGKNKGEITNQIDLNSGGLVSPALNSPYLMQIGSFDYPYLFVIDAEKRILQYQKSNGAFVQQIRAENKEFDSIKDLLVDEANQKIYVVTDQKIYIFRVPSAAVSGNVPVISTTPSTTPTTSR
ncbi:MAG: hypothetical protein HXX08_05805 [Chloroflexi bacterium]|uniref:Uncharacterized protein n=1 Tax=Candidatus Chlorohelix allophototropha TaxID=3003348 RepID=A0A8T7LWX5_9CHLR|nr:hypothetical protein [Chloroflexota bacterium]WJW67249.1 hypothetical protein OZ401_000508 [Chloroflexota bacterium L227-S17]